MGSFRFHKRNHFRIQILGLKRFSKKSRQLVKMKGRAEEGPVHCSGSARELPIRVRQTRSTFHRHAQRNASLCRDVRLQSRSFARWNQSLRPSPNSLDPDSPSTRAILTSGSHYFGLSRETAGATTRIDMQWLQPPSNPEANEVYRFYLPLITVFP